MDVISQFWWGDDDQGKKCIGTHGGNYASQRRKEVWVSRISTLLI
jgi:hypothetical protein